MTLGSRGALVSAQGKARQIPPFPVEKPTDTTGAGDSFWGAFLYRFVKSGKSPQEITVTDAADFAAWGNAAASLCIRKRGGIPALPSLEAVEALLSGSETTCRN